MSVTFKEISTNNLKQKPSLFFGPNLQKCSWLNDKVKAKLRKFSKPGLNSFMIDGQEYLNIDTTNLGRNLSKSGISEGKGVVEWMKKSDRLGELATDEVDSANFDLFELIGEDFNDLQGLSALTARAFPLYNSKKLARDNESKRVISLKFSTYSKSYEKNIDSKNLLNLMENIRGAAKLSDMPPNLLHPATFVEEARSQLKDFESVSIQVFDHEELGKRNMNLLKSVGEGSAEGKKARMCILKYEPERSPDRKKSKLNKTNVTDSSDRKLKTIALVGKGITYDTGGHSLKTKTTMPGMKKDCSGATAMLFTFKQLVQSNFKKANVICVLCLAENNIGPLATKPDDIYIGHSGLSVDIQNTDAEGRLALADGVSYVSRELNADVVIDMCTLTGTQRVAVGLIHGALLTNKPEVEPIAIQAGLNSGDHIYPIIYAPTFFMKEFDSKMADMTNHVTRNNGNSSCAGHFIEQHLEDGTKFKGTWIHIDMSAPALNMYDAGRHSGYGVALIANLVDDLV